MLYVVLLARGGIYSLEQSDTQHLQMLYFRSGVTKYQFLGILGRAWQNTGILGRAWQNTGILGRAWQNSTFISAEGKSSQSQDLDTIKQNFCPF